MSNKRDVECVLFDLDGTLVDTAPDLIAALNRLRESEYLPPVPVSQLRSQASNGSAGLISHGMPKTDESQRAKWIERFLQEYADQVYCESRLFPGMQLVLDRLSAEQVPWGIVTNKPAFLTEALLDEMKISPPLSALVCGDTLEVRKPHPDPILLGCQQAEAQPQYTLYVGDAQRDIEAGKAAGCYTSVAMYGYLQDQDQPDQWQADQMINQPQELLEWLNGRGGLG